MKVINGVWLVVIEYVDIFVDDLFLVKGVVVEGFEGYFDIDYISEVLVIVRWNGFIDYESGIMKYCIGIGEYCFIVVEMNVYFYDLLNNFSFYELLEVYFKVNLLYDGFYYVLVLVYNNVLELLEVVCLDGVFCDMIFIKVIDLILELVKVKFVIGCYDNKVWYIFENLMVYEF